MDPIEVILREIQSLDLKALLAYLASKGIVDYTAKGYDKIKELVRAKHDAKMYGFVPNKQEAEKLKELGKNPGYGSVNSLIPTYPYIDVIRTGLLVKQYYDDNDGNSAGRIKIEILKRPNGKKMMSIVHLTCSDYFSVVINYLNQLRNEKGYIEKQLLDKFDEIINEWGETHLAVKSSYSKKIIIGFCLGRMKGKRRNIFLLGMGRASRNIEEVITQLQKEKKFENLGYEPLVLIKKGGVEPRIEVILRYRTETDKFIEDQACKS